MEVTAYLRKLRIAPRKVALVLDQVRGLVVTQALQLLTHLPQAAATPVRRLVNSAVANAAHNHGLEPTTLLIKRIYVTQGATLKRMQPRAQGRTFHIRKRSSHLTVCLTEQTPVKS